MPTRRDLPNGPWPDVETLRRLADEAGRWSAAPPDSWPSTVLLTPAAGGRNGMPDGSLLPDASGWNEDLFGVAPVALPAPVSGDVTGRSTRQSPAAAAGAPVQLPGEAELQRLVGSALASVDAVVRDATDSALYFVEPTRVSVPDWPPARSSAVLPQSQGVTGSFDPFAVRSDFPILQERVNGRSLVWFDNAATTQKPRAVIDRLTYFYEHENSNVHRAAHELAGRATDAYEGAREKVRAFLHAQSTNEIVFVRGATEAINLVAQSWGRQFIARDDEIVVTWLEHHANIVPWQQLAAASGARLRVAPVDDDGQIVLEEYGRLLGPRTKLVALAHVSNALGTITPVREMVRMAHDAGAKALVDGAQAVSHLSVDVRALDADWYVFSGHKLFAPTGVGVLYGKEWLLNEAPPWQGGGNMIRDVSFERTEYQSAPLRFEAGTGTLADAVGLGAAIDYVTGLGLDQIGAYEHQLLIYATRLLKEIPGLRLIGTAADKASVLSFVIAGHRTEDIGAALNREGIAVRAGHHCAQPILRRFGVESTVRPSLAFYNTCGEVDRFVAVLTRLVASRPPATF